nr:hypothetical protein [Tanacetum cinerariifolium]
MLMVEDIGGTYFRQYAEQNLGNQIAYNARQITGNQKLHSKAKEKRCCLSLKTVADCSKGKGGIQLNLEEFDFMDAARAYDKIEKLNANSTLKDNLQQALTSEEAKFVRDLKSLAKYSDESLDKIMVLEKENERLLGAVVSQDIMSIVQSPSVVETSDHQTELECT